MDVSRAVRRLLNQSAVLWTNVVNDGRGNLTGDAPVEIWCRWDIAQELYVDAEGKEARSNAVIYVDTEVSVGDFIMLGTLADLDGDDPLDNSAAYEIKSIGVTPDKHAVYCVRKAIV